MAEPMTQAEVKEMLMEQSPELTWEQILAQLVQEVAKIRE
jgi:hypothetical protein